MNKALILVVAIFLSPTIPQAAPVKRFKFNGRATEATVSLYGQQETTKWSTLVSIAQSGSSVTINFQLNDGSTTRWKLRKSGSQ